MSIPYPAGEPLTCGQIREVDILAIEHVGIPGLVLMENAGRFAAEFIYEKLVDPPHARVLILCGPGNNGGDGFVVARHLANAGVHVTVVPAAPRAKYHGDAATNLRIIERLDYAIIDAADANDPRPERLSDEFERADMIVDALLGTGATGAPRPPMDRLIRQANAAVRATRIAIDLPSGLDGDTGEVATPCFAAHATVTLVAPKAGFAAPGAAEVLGRVVTGDIGVPRHLIPGRTHFSEPGLTG